jgi:hypothetical protein
MRKFSKVSIESKKRFAYEEGFMFGISVFGIVRVIIPMAS